MYIKKKKIQEEYNKKCKCVDCIYCIKENDLYMGINNDTYVCEEYSNGSNDFDLVICCYVHHTGSLLGSMLYDKELYACTRYEPIKDSPYKQFQLF